MPNKPLPPIPGWPFVRTQIAPEARERCRELAARLGWRMPGIYTAAIHYLLLARSVNQAENLLIRHLELPGDESRFMDGTPCPPES